MIKKLSYLFAVFAIILFGCVGCVGKISENSDDTTPEVDDTTLERWISEKPDDTTLEFWITEDVSSIDFSDYYARVDIFGAREYYGYGYHPVDVIESMDIPPEHCVIYTVSGYPDASDAWNYVTRIKITDPDISVYGITCNSSLEEFDEIMQGRGYEIYESSEMTHTATLEKVCFRLNSYNGQGQLIISVEVSNKWGIHW